MLPKTFDHSGAVRLEEVLSVDGLDSEVAAFRPLNQEVAGHNRVQVVGVRVLGQIHLEVREVAREDHIQVLEVAREDRTQVREAGLALEVVHEDRNLDLGVGRVHRMASGHLEVVDPQSQGQADQVEVLDGDHNLVQAEALVQDRAVEVHREVGRVKVLDDLVATLMTGPVRRGRCCCH